MLALGVLSLLFSPPIFNAHIQIELMRCVVNTRFDRNKRLAALGFSIGHLRVWVTSTNKVHKLRLNLLKVLFQHR